MESNQEALLRGILENPSDLVVRKVYADFLEETGQTEEAAIIRLSLELGEFGRGKMLLPEHYQSLGSERNPSSTIHRDILYSQKYRELLDLVKPSIHKEFGLCGISLNGRSLDLSYERSLHFDNGFVSRVRCSKSWLLYCATNCFKKHPITRLHIDRVRYSNRRYWGFKLWFGGNAKQDDDYRLNLSPPDFEIGDITLPCHVGGEFLLEVPLQYRSGGHDDYISNVVVDYFRVINGLPPIYLKDSLSMFVFIQKMEKEQNSEFRLTIR